MDIYVKNWLEVYISNRCVELSTCLPVLDKTLDMWKFIFKKWVVNLFYCKFIIFLILFKLLKWKLGAYAILYVRGVLFCLQGFCRRHIMLVTITAALWPALHMKYSKQHQSSLLLQRDPHLVLCVPCHSLIFSDCPLTSFRLWIW